MDGVEVVGRARVAFGGVQLARVSICLRDSTLSTYREEVCIIQEILLRSRKETQEGEDECDEGGDRREDTPEGDPHLGQ